MNEKLFFLFYFIKECIIACNIGPKKSQIELFRIVDLIADAGLGSTTAATSGLEEPKPSLQCKKSPFVNHVVVAARRAAAATAKLGRPARMVSSPASHDVAGFHGQLPSICLYPSVKPMQDYL